MARKLDPPPTLYRCYLLDDRHKVAAVEILSCLDDGAATRAARALLAQRNAPRLRYFGVEVWDLARLVYAHAPDGVPDASKDPAPAARGTPCGGN